MQKRHIPPVQTPRVRLRLLEERDLPQTLAWRNQDGIRRWFFSSQRLTPEQHAEWFARYRQRDDDFVFIIEEAGHPHTGTRLRPIGQAALYDIDWVRGTAQYGRLMIGETDAAGRGLAREVTDALVALALGQLGLQEIHLEVLPGNVRAIKVYEACGFEVAGSTEKALRMSKRAVPAFVVPPLGGIPPTTGTRYPGGTTSELREPQAKDSPA
jgi:diamine N-acetyltransferase